MPGTEDVVVVSDDPGTDNIPGTAIPGEQTPEEIGIETSAREKGWRPKEEYQGGEGSWIGADEFLKREPLFDKIRGQSSEIKNLKKTVEAMVNQHQTQVAAQVKAQLKELAKERTEAIQVGDEDKVNEIEAAIVETRQQAAIAPPEANNEVTQWIKENPWFESNKEMNDFAVAYNKAQFAKNGGDAMKSLVATRAAIEKAFPDEFKVPENKQPTGGPDNGGEPKGGQGKKGYSLDRLSSDQKLVYNQHVKVHKILSHEDYFKGLEEIGELS